MGLLGKAFSAGFEPPFNGPIHEWARNNIVLGPSYTVQGAYHPEKSRWLIPVFEALRDERVRVVNVLKATQSGGSLIADIYVPWTLDNAPGPVMWNFHTDKMAKDHSETRAMPTIRSVKRLARLMPEDRHKMRTQETIFRHGVPLYIQGPSEANLQAKSIRIEVNDECWQWPPGRLREARARVRAYRDAGVSKELNISQGGDCTRDTNYEIIGDDWAVLAHDAELWSWEVQCLLCPGRFLPRIEEVGESGERVYRLKWDKGGLNVRYQCPHCGGDMVWTDRLRAHWNSTGAFVRVNELTPNMRKIESGTERQDAKTFHWPALICSDWQVLVEDYRKAITAKRSGQLLPLRAFLQKEMAYFWDEHAEALTRVVNLRSDDYDPREAWAEEHTRFMTVDCQLNFLLFYVVVRAWSKTGESRRLFRGTAKTWDEVRQLQLDWNVKCRHVGVDAGYQGPRVYTNCARYMDEDCRMWFALYGRSQESFLHHFKGKKAERRVYSDRQLADPMMGFKSSDKEKFEAALTPAALSMLRRGSLKVWFYLWSQPSVADILDNLMNGRGAPWLSPNMESAQPEEREYRRHLMAEVKRPETDKHGNTKETWVTISQNNHWLDCERMQVVCASLGGVLAS